MKRPFVFFLVAFALLSAVAGVAAAPLAQEQRPVIAEPGADAAVRGVVQIVGTATHPEFQRYELYYAPWPVPSDQSWVFIGDAHFNQQPLGLLGTWDSRSVPDGAYGLRLRVVKADGNYLDSDARRVLVANTRPVESPTPDASPTPESFPTELPPTQEVVVAAPTIAPVGTVVVEPTPTLEPEEAVEVSPTPTRRPVIAGADTGGDDAEASIASQLFSGTRLLGVAEKAAKYTLGFFLAIGAFFAVKALLVWLWYKIRP